MIGRYFIIRLRLDLIISNDWGILILVLNGIVLMIHGMCHWVNVIVVDRNVGMYLLARYILMVLDVWIALIDVFGLPLPVWSLHLRINLGAIVSLLVVQLRGFWGVLWVVSSCSGMNY